MNELQSMGDNGSWIMRTVFGANQVDRPSEFAIVQPQQKATVCLPLLHCGCDGVSETPQKERPFGHDSGLTQSRRRRLSQLDSTQLHPAAAPLRPSSVFGLLLLSMSRSGPPDAPLLGPGDFEPAPGLGRGQALLGTGAYVWASVGRWWYSAPRRSGRTG